MGTSIKKRETNKQTGRTIARRKQQRERKEQKVRMKTK